MLPWFVQTSRKNAMKYKQESLETNLKAKRWTFGPFKRLVIACPLVSIQAHSVSVYCHPKCIHNYTFTMYFEFVILFLSICLVAPAFLYSALELFVSLHVVFLWYDSGNFNNFVFDCIVFIVGASARFSLSFNMFEFYDGFRFLTDFRLKCFTLFVKTQWHRYREKAKTRNYYHKVAATLVLNVCTFMTIFMALH